MNTAVSPVAITSPSRKSRWEFTPREEHIAAKWRKPSAVYGDIVYNQTMLQLGRLAYIPVGLLAVACGVEYVTDLMLWAFGRTPYFNINHDFFVIILIFPAIFMLQEVRYTTQIASLKYIGQLQESCFEQGNVSHD